MPRTGRPPGFRGPGAKFPDVLVPRIRSAYAAGRTAEELARELGVNPATVLACVKGKRYRDVGGPISVGKGDHAVRGTRHPFAKLNESCVLEIRAAAACGETVRSLAVRYRVSQRSICCVVNRLTWSHVVDADREVAG
jgi:hypothetical protein